MARVAPPVVVALLLSGALLQGCPNAPPPLPGAPVGGACRADLDCGDGLVCACGLCATPGADDEPPSCDVDLSAACGDPEPCYAACGDLAEVGESVCPDGAPFCEAGVREDDCPPETCWGEPAPGEVCDNGVFVCVDGRSSLGGCYTPGACGEVGPVDAGPDAGATASECVFDCADEVTFPQVCIAGELTCENGFAQEQCGGCVGVPPTCVFDCVDVEPIAPAVCAAGEFSCGFVVGAVPATDCGCLDQTVDLLDAEDVALLDGVTCSLGTIFALYDEPLLELRDLEVSGEILIFGGEIQTARFPRLRNVWGNFTVNATPLLSSVEAPELRRVDGDLSFLSAPNLPACQARALAAQLSQPPDNLTIAGLDEDAGCPDVDAGPADAGPDGGG